MVESSARSFLPRIKAFLSHASIDKPYVDVVAKRLGRQRVQYDQWIFEKGTDFITAIREALSRSGSFVLFASKAALQSLWVRFEMDEAEELLRTDMLKSALVLIIDGVTRHSDLPKWMQRALVDSAPNPNAAARLIAHHLNRLRGLEPNPLFIGRDTLLSEFSEKLIPALESQPPHLLIAGGLSGIGRRTFLRRALSDFLSLPTGPSFHLKPTDGLDVLHLELLDELGPLDTKEELASAIEQFQGASLTGKAKTIAQLLASAALGNVAPIIVDDGGLMDSSGGYTQETLAVFDALRAFPESVVGIVHTKRPAVQEGSLAALGAVFVRVPPLDLASTKLLLNQMIRRHGIEATSDQVAELGPYLDGYPPAVNLAVSLAREYGMSTLIADKSGLVDFKIRTFAGALERLVLSERQWKILRVLAAEFALTLPGVVAMASGAEEEVAKDLRDLIDLNLVLASGNLFTIAAPIRSAIQSLRGTLSGADFTAIAKVLKSTYWDGVETLPPIDVIEATIHAVLRSQTPDLSDFRGFVLPSVLYRASKEYYDRGGEEAWELARRFVKELLLLDPNHRPGLVLQAKTLVRLSEWSQAREAIADIERRGFPECHYLKGFMFWKKREFSKAVTDFRAALAIGQDSMEIYHGLGSCLVRLNELSEAEKTVKRGLRGRRPNSLLLDLAAQIAIIQKQYSDAEDYIDQLRRIRAFDDYNFRLATLHNARKQFRSALPLAEAAMTGPRRRFEVEATFIDTLIEVREFKRASEVLDELDRRQRIGRDKESVRLGLRCKLDLRQGKWQEAERAWASIGDKDSPVHMALRAEILEQKIADLKTTPGSRATARTELDQIRAAAAVPNIGLYATPEHDAESGRETDVE